MIATRDNRAHLNYVYKYMKRINRRLWSYRLGALMFAAMGVVAWSLVSIMVMQIQALGDEIRILSFYLNHPRPFLLLFAVSGWCLGYFPSQYGPLATARDSWRETLESVISKNTWHRQAFLELEEIDPRLFRKIIRVTRLHV